MVILISSFIVILYASTLTVFYLVLYSENILSIKLLEPVSGSYNVKQPTETSRRLLIAASILLPIIYSVLAVCIFLFPEIAWSTGLLVPFLGSFTYFAMMIILQAKWWKDKGSQVLSDLVVTGIVLLLLVALFKQQYVIAVFLQPFLEKVGANTPRNVLLSYGTFIMFLSFIGLIFSKSYSWPRTIVLVISTLCGGYLVVELVMQWPK